MTTKEQTYTKKEEQMQNIPHIDEFNTGDILLFSDKTFIPSRLIEYFSGSKYSHVGIILKDPQLTEEPLEGLYILESTGFNNLKDVEDNKKKVGAQITPLEKVINDYNGAVFWRKLTCERNDYFYEKLAEAHKVVHNKPYDMNIKDWFKSWKDIEIGNEQNTDRFFCSAMVTFIYDKLGFVPKETPWSIIRPKDLGTEDPKDCRLTFQNCEVCPEIIVKHYNSFVHNVYNTY